jgi:RNA polymerase sigma-70 factor, ECF subfamily
MDNTVTEKPNAPQSGARGGTAFEGLIRRFYTGVYNHLVWMCRDTSLAEDLTQETFLQVWQHLPDLRKAQATKAWIHRIARNQYLQHHRRVGVETVAIEQIEDTEPAIWNPAEIRIDQMVLREALGELPEIYREIIVLHNLEELSLPEIGQILEIPLGTVKSRRAKALCLLREALRKQEVADHEV